MDHDHDTGFVRGLLCNRCNRAIASFNDSPALLNMASLYLHAASAAWDSMDDGQQEGWLPYRGRSSGKGRRTRIRKSRSTDVNDDTTLPFLP